MKVSRPSLVIVGHGSSASSEAEHAVREHAITLRQSNRYGEVVVQFLTGNCEPIQLPEGEVYLLPFFMSNGYFVRKRIPALFGLEFYEKHSSGQHLYQCDAIGVDPTLSTILMKMAEEICREEQYSTSEVTVILVAHGSGKSSASREAAELQVKKLQEKKCFGAVTSVFLEEEPSMENWLRSRSADDAPAIFVGLFAAEGMHATEDVRKELDQGAEAQPEKHRRIHYAGVVGVRPEIVRLIQESISRRASQTAAQAD